MTELEKAMARFAEKQTRGLVDMKFLVVQGQALSEEEFFAASNRIDDAVERSCVRRQVWADDMTPVAFAPLLD